MNRIFDEEKGGRVLAFGAHPDDLEVGAGGLLARLSNEGADVTMCVVSIPNRGDERAAEARAGAEVIGADLFILYEGKPCRVEDIPMHELVGRFDQLVGDLRPDLVITHSGHDLHWDHGLVNRATVSALRRTPCDLLSFLSSPEMNAQSRSYGQCFADISTTMDTKLAAISAHKSQLPKLDLESSRDLARAMGRISGVAYAEAYEVLRVRI
ncbi:MAG: PIG-L family deacetylase [Kofleriaceae bacterium]|nr:PIG-L family deacetylase [Myxococcales bacterium]MCB9558947.1 PIG-L family deacetylase [Kofleriaceae bacterium]MCB9570495.1 PIG-L family deacetylase [Kofleriaceae bacterium]